jgi:hypothetical protein
MGRVLGGLGKAVEIGEDTHASTHYFNGRSDHAGHHSRLLEHPPRNAKYFA